MSFLPEKMEFGGEFSECCVMYSFILPKPFMIALQVFVKGSSELP